MSNAIVRFEENNVVPSYLRSVPVDTDTGALANLLVGGIKTLSISGKVFTVGSGDAAKIIMRPDDDETPASHIELVVIKANTHYTKTYYKKAYVSGVDATPDCSSLDGKVPDPAVAEPQCKTCAACPHNVFGSKGKGKACQDNLRLAVAAPDHIDEPMLLRLPPTSFAPFGEQVEYVKNRGGGLDRCIFRFKFDPESETPRLLVKALGWVTEDWYNQIQQMRDSSIVNRILTVGAVQTLAKAKTEDEDNEPAPAKKSKPRDEDDDEPAPAKKSKPKAEDEAPAKKPKLATVSSTETKSKAASLLSKLSASAADDDDSDD